MDKYLHELIDLVSEKKNLHLSISLMDGNTHINIYPYDISDEKTMWLKTTDLKYFKCSACNRSTDNPYPYCPHCGEQMSLSKSLALQTKK